MKTRLRLCTLAATGTAALLSAGCVNLDPRPDASRYFTLTATDPAPPRPADTKARVSIRAIVSTEYLNQPLIAVRSSDNELRPNPKYRWAENIETGLARVLAANLQRRVAIASVSPNVRTSFSNADCVVDVAIVAFDGTEQGGALLEVYWRLLDKDLALQQTGHFRREASAWDGSNYGDLADGLSTLVDELAAELAGPVLAVIEGGKADVDT